MRFAANGFGYGLMQEFLKATLRLALPPRPDWTAVDEALALVIPASHLAGDTPATTLAGRIIHWTAELQRAGNQPVYDKGRLIGTGESGATITLALPTIDALAAGKALKLVVELISGLLGGVSARDAAMAAAHAAYAAYVKEFSSKGIGGSNNLRFLQAAYENRMPWFRLYGTVLQIGMGARARWLDSSFTDATPVIGSNLARNKLAAAEMLRQSGLPVPDHKLADTPQAAVKIAAGLGYPVVVKPVDKDGGVGVAAGLNDEASVVRAFEAARKVSKAVMVEKHVDGKDYRLVVFQGRLIWALERVPGSVTGDGVSTVRELVARRNQEPGRIKRFGAPLAPIVINDEATTLLAERGMDLESVPENGDWIRLRRIANIASGGTPEGVFDKVHPDNRLLAERAAKALRLDLAGVDLLIPDIERSWMESGAAICEVNAQPTIGYTTSAHLYGEILKGLVKGNGRIPIALIIGAADESPVPELVSRMLAAVGLRVGLATSRQVRLNGRLVCSPPTNIFNAARTLMADTDTDAAVVAVSDLSVTTSCLPFDRCSVVTLAGSHFEGASDGEAALKTLSRQMLPASWGAVVINSGDPACLALASSITGARVALASAEPGTAPVREQVGAGGSAVFIEGEPDDPRLVVGKDAINLREIGGEGAPVICTLEDIAVAAATVWMMGGTLDNIRHGLAGIQWTVPAPAGA